MLWSLRMSVTMYNCCMVQGCCLFLPSISIFFGNNTCLTSGSLKLICKPNVCHNSFSTSRWCHSHHASRDCWCYGSVVTLTITILIDSGTNSFHLDQKLSLYLLLVVVHKDICHVISLVYVTLWDYKMTMKVENSSNFDCILIGRSCKDLVFGSFVLPGRTL